jgi:hypothetical protein
VILRCWPRTVNVSPRTSRNAHPPFLQAFEGTPGRLPPGGLFYACKKVVLQLFGAPYPRRGAMVVPSGIAQAFPGRSHLAIPGQIGPSRHHHCPAYLAAEPPRVRRTVRTILRSSVCGSGPRPRKGAKLPAKVAPQDAREISNGSNISVSGILPAGTAGLSLARQAPTDRAS